MSPRVFSPQHAGGGLLAFLLATSALASCGANKTNTSTASDNIEGAHKSERESVENGRDELTLTQEGLGPLNAETKATLDGLQELFPDYEVKGGYPPGLGPGNALGAYDLHVRANDKTLFLVIPGDRHEVLSLRVFSPEIATAKGWRVGAALSETDTLRACSCTGDGLFCTGDDPRLGVILDDDCLMKIVDGSREYLKLGNGDPSALAQLKGRRIAMLRWDATIDDPPEPGKAGAGTPTAPLHERLAKCDEKPSPPEQAKCQAIEQAREAGVLGE